MNPILATILIIIAIGLAFWLDKFNRAERDKARKIYNFIFQLNARCKWGREIEEIKKELLADGEENIGIRADGEHEILSLTKVVGHSSVKTSFFFIKQGSMGLEFLELLIDGAEERDLIFSEMIKVHGRPVLGIGGEGEDMDLAIWEFGDNLLTFESTDEGGALLRIMRKDPAESSQTA